MALIQSLNEHNLVFFRTTLPLGIRQQCRAQPLVPREECFVGCEGEKIFSILTTTRLREDIGLREDCEAWKKFLHVKIYFLVSRTISSVDNTNVIS